MRIDILCLFPEMFASPLNQSIINRAREQGLVEIVIHDIRDYTHDKHHTVDDYPYGCGPGMVFKPEPIFEAVEAIKGQLGLSEIPIILLTPQGSPFSQAIARRLSQHNHLIFICGHYEGVDERVREHLVTDEISIGDYVLSGGELAAIVLIDAMARMLPGVLGDADSAQQDSFMQGLLDCPHYTRPEQINGVKVPEVLLSGDHKAIARWRLKQSLGRTWLRRPDLLEQLQLDKEQQALLDEFQREYQQAED